MEYPILDGALEVRARDGRRVLSGRFPYGKTATVRSAGRTRKERFASGSMYWQVREFEKLQGELAKVVASALDKAAKAKRAEALEDALEKRNTFLLTGHDYNRTLADMRTGTLAVTHTREAVELEATLPPEGEGPSWVEDAVRAVRGGQLRGISPGFAVPAGKGGERLVREDGPGDALVREILDCVVFEYSLVARPAYAETTVDARAYAATLVERRRRVWL